mmetsp:Transcript_3649/g.13088  ORF Transcript_3649/g.13088 Transcript_3649/m.13088 type:complete len:934 (+) Transcript_3649:263-3064(+)
MPLRLEIKRQLAQRSDRVKSVDLHPTEPWILSNLYNGNIYIWNTNTSTLVKSFEVTELPVRSAKFIARKNWIVAGADDMFIRVYNYNTMDKVKAFEAHTDYIRCVAVHPTLPYVLSSSDDMLIKIWDWDKNWACTQVFEGHSHYVMQVVFNPKDTNTFASASLDRTIKVWSLGSLQPNFTLEGHEKGVNCVDYFSGGDRPYLISGADDKLVKVWDYQTKSCVQTLEGHTHNVSAVMFHPELPIIVTGSEDGTVRIWHNTTYRLENTLNYGMERVWALGYTKGSNMVGVGYDEGTVLIKVGREEPVASMDASGKIVWARHSEIQTVNVKTVDADVGDGERIPLPVKELGSCDLYPQILKHNPNGRFVSVCGDGEYIVYTALAWRNKSFGPALDVAWSMDNEFAARESPSKIKVFRNFQEKGQIRPNFNAEGLHGGALLGVRSQDFVCFYDWAECRVLRRIDVACKDIFWSESGELVVISSENSFYILRYDAQAVADALAEGRELDEQGVEEAFELLHEVGETIRTGLWVGDCFVYNNSNWRLNYVVGGEVTVMFHLDRPMYILGYMAAQNRLYMIDKEFSVVCYTLLLSLVEYKTLVMRDEMEAAAQLLPSIPVDQLNGVARFLESRGMPEEALEVAQDADYKFELAIQLGRLDVARDIAETDGSDAKWRQLGELAMSAGKLVVAEECLRKADDMSGMLLLYSSMGNAAGMEALATRALAKGKSNVAFLCLFSLGRIEECIELLANNGRVPEAAFLARTYMPSKVNEVIELWREDLRAVNPKAAEALADPESYENLFPDFATSLKAEEQFLLKREEVLPADAFPEYEGSNAVDLIAQLKELDLEEDAPVENGTNEEMNGEVMEDAEEDLDGVVEDAEPEEEDVAGEAEEIDEPEEEEQEEEAVDELEEEADVAAGGDAEADDDVDDDDWGMTDS